MAAAPSAGGTRIRTALENELQNPEGPKSKRSKGRRQWSSKLPSTSTPIRAGTKTKTPIRHRREDKVSFAELLPVEVDEQTVQLDEQMKSLRIHVSEMQKKLDETRDGQYVFRVQQLWALKSQIKEQREKAASEQCLVGWPSDATAEHRTEFIT